MSSPITWQNVQGRSLAEAAIPMQGASQSILGGFDRMGKVFDQYQGMEQKKLDMADEANVQGFLDRLQSARTPEAVAELQASGELDTLRSVLKPTSLAKVRGAEDSRLETLQNQITKGQTFKQEQDRIAQLPIAQQAEVLAAKGDTVGLDALLKSNPNLLNPAKYLSAAKTVVDTDTKNRLEGEKAATQMARDLAQVGLTQAQTADIPADNARLDQEQVTRNYDRVVGQIAENTTKLGKMESGVIGSKDAMGTVITNLGKVIEDKNALGKLTGYLSTALGANPEYSKLPSDVVQSIALKYSNELGWLGSASVKAIQADLDKAVLESGGSLQATAAARSALVNTIQQQRLVADDLLRQANPELQKRIDEAAAKTSAAPTTVGTPPTTSSPAAETQVTTPASEKRQEDARVAQLARIEQAEKAAGMRKEFTKEVGEYLDKQTMRDRESIVGIGETLGSTALSLGNAFNDIVTLPVRAAGGATNTLLRLPNAFGAGIPYIPDQGGVLSSLTPYSDRQRADVLGQSRVEEAKAMRAAFEKEQTKLRADTKKAK